MAVPSDLSGLIAWYKADSLALSGGASVSSWADSSTSGFTATQAVGGSQPTYNTAQVNGLPAVSFDGGDSLDSALPAGPTGIKRSMFVVLRTSGAIGTRRALLGNSGSGLGIRRDLDDKMTSEKQGGAEIGKATNVMPTGVWTVQTFTYDNGATDDYAWYSDGTANGSGSVTANAFTTSITSELGYNPTNSFFWLGDLAEIVVYDRVLTAAERAQIHTYVQDKYAITVADYVPGNVAAPQLWVPGFRRARGVQTPQPWTQRLWTFDDPVSTIQTAAVTARADVGAQAQAAVVKVAKPTVSSTLGAQSVAASRKSAPAVGLAPVGLASLDTTRKSAPVTPRSTLGLVATPATRKSAPAVLLSALGLSGTVSRVPTAAVVARAVIGVVSTMTGRKSAPAAALSPVALASTDTVRKSAPVAPRSTVGLTSSGLVTKVAKATGAAAVGLTGLVGRVPSVSVVARAAFGLVSRVTVTKKVSAAPLSAVGASSTVTARRVAKPTALAGAGLSAAGTVAKKVTAAVRSVLGLSAAAPTSPATSPGQMYPREGTSATMTPAELAVARMDPNALTVPQMDPRESTASTMTGG